MTSVQNEVQDDVTVAHIYTTWRFNFTMRCFDPTQTTHHLERKYYVHLGCFLNSVWICIMNIQCIKEGNDSGTSRHLICGPMTLDGRYVWPWLEEVMFNFTGLMQMCLSSMNDLEGGSELFNCWERHAFHTRNTIIKIQIWGRRHAFVRQNVTTFINF